mmetsp:Transcript_87544/g.245926  ORF Transcript_87544/g.245926 Transcript_87544/m.245926 type:complete len:616 (+) Transcript_87544:93-1940(+)
MAALIRTANPSLAFLPGLSEDGSYEIPPESPSENVPKDAEPLDESQAGAVSPEAGDGVLSTVSTEASLADPNLIAPARRKLVPQYEAQNLDVPVVIVSSELCPWSKSGGLAIVASAYAYHFAHRGHRTMAIAPMYDQYEGAFFQCTKSFELFGAWHEVRFFHHYQSFGEGKGCDYVFIDHPSFHRPGGLYHNVNQGREYEDNLFRFALFSLAALEVPVGIELGGSPRYGGKCVFIANDWQTGLLPVYMQHRHRACGNYNDARCIFVVHNLGYQGCYPRKIGIPPEPIYDNFAQLGLPEAALGDLMYQYPVWERAFEGDTGETLNLSKGALITCDRILTVSPGYAMEIGTPEGGFRLNDVISWKRFYVAGILNGIDDSWDPTRDRKIAATFSARNLEGKRACKARLQKKLGLDADADCAIVAFVGRLTAQKGLDLIGAAMEWLMDDDKDGLNRVQIVMMGNGDPCYGDMLKWAEGRWKGRACGYYGFDPQVEREIVAGGDFFLMPSRYEPCGLPQMCAMAYGTVPIVHATGGLRDSVVNWYTDEAAATGYHIWPLNEHSLKKVVFDALDVYFRKPELHSAMMMRAMAQDFGWVRAMDEYERHVDYTLSDPPFYGRA